MKDTIIIRADASVAIGTGHVMRCLALAQAWQRNGGEALFLQAESTPAIARRLQDSQMKIEVMAERPGSSEDATRTLKVARQLGARWVIADGYRFDAEWQQTVKGAGIYLLVLDDYGHAAHYYADFVLNQNLSARADRYGRREPHTRLLLGPSFALLRKEFLEWRSKARQRELGTRRILVTLGGSDPHDVTSRVLAALADLPALEIVAVVGGSNPNLPRLALWAEAFPQLRLVVDVQNMPELMDWADLAITAAGSTSWELALLGLPSVAIVTAANQTEVAAALECQGLGVSLGEHRSVSGAEIAAAVVDLLADYPRREKMGRRGRALIDGGGAARVVTRLRSRCLRVRAATDQDSRQLWEWANDPGVRDSAFQQAAIPWETHERWFAEKKNARNTVIYIGSEVDGPPLGQVRFDWTSDGTAHVDVSVAPPSRNAGWGSALIRRAVDEVFATRPVRKIEAFVKPENVSSLRAFERAGFANHGEIRKDGHAAVRCSLSSNDE